MSGLIYRNFYINRTTFLFSLITTVLCCITAILLAIFIGGADAIKEDGNTSSIVPVYSLLYYLAFMLPAIASTSLFEADENKIACSFAMACPLGGKGHIESKYYYTLILDLTMLFMTFIADVVTFMIFGGKVSLTIPLLFIFCWRILLSAIEIPFVIRFGSQRGVAIKGIVIAVIFIFIMTYFLFGDISWLIQNEDDPIAAFTVWLQSGDIIFGLGLFPYISIAAFYLSCKISVRLFGKGAENYEQ